MIPAPLNQELENPEDWWEELLLRDGRFRERVAQVRNSVQEGRGVSIEELREKYDIQSEADNQAD